MMAEAQMFWDSIVGKIRNLIRRETANAFRAERYEVTTAPNGTVIGVTKALGSKEIFLPYSQEVSTAVVGQPVLVVWWGSMSNAKVYYYANGYNGGGGGGGTGYTFIPDVSEAGIISWTNNGGLPNPTPRDIMGPEGEPGVYVGDDEPTDPDIKVWIDTSGGPDGPGAYSESETDTGNVWIDGKKIYRRVINCGALTANTIKTINAGLTGVTQVVNLYAIGLDVANYFPIPYCYTGSGTLSAWLYFASGTGQLVIKSPYASAKTYAIIEYTK